METRTEKLIRYLRYKIVDLQLNTQNIDKIFNHVFDNIDTYADQKTVDDFLAIRDKVEATAEVQRIDARKTEIVNQYPDIVKP